MKNIVIDTCTVLHILKDSPQGKKCLEEIEKLGENPHIIISVATKAELDSFSLQNQWRQKKIQALNKFLNELTTIDINQGDKQLLDAYSLIDGYSKRKLTDPTGNKLLGSARKMGKNDLWIAATAKVINAPLLTTDGDFNHLNGVLLTVIKII